ncbi:MULTISPECIES: type II toxin-antitoxin system RelE/ParE family toxin [unclassified Bradyrhizobium]|uniref:type II toxin-antitoxin system RelE/ParE family toxin n=1 Tax=unclassified Bradyrhizobium TaxID=2631580 RepID=UPI0029164513|nr:MULTISPECIES: type II toxin-antitoxin system RelE/ParE family toxin [unclassified Bradyrhizobium]
MPIELVWSNQAWSDLLDIYLLIWVDQPAAAERHLDRIEAKFELLRSQPRMGARRSDPPVHAYAGRGALPAALPNRPRHGRRSG